ncbi:MAG: lipopolysaccharide biosynthesis protein, partial [Candidatus Heimdallarchaeaceae archaeon]
IILEFFIALILVFLYFTFSIKVWFLNIEPYIIFLMLISVVALSQIFSTTCFTIATSLQNSRYYLIVVVMRVLLQIPFGIFFVVGLNLGVLGLIAGLASAEFTTALYSGYKILRNVGIGKYSFSQLKRIVEFSLPVYYTGFLWYFFDLLLLLMVQAFDSEGNANIALFRYGALTVVNLLMLPNNLFRMVYRPVIYKYYEKEQFNQISDITLKIFKVFIVFIIPVALLLYGFSPLLIRFFTKAEYVASIKIIPILLLSIAFIYAQNIVAYGHALHFKNYWNAISGSISFVLATIVGYFTIKIDSLFGLAFAYLTLRFFYFVGLTIASQHYIKVKLNLWVILKLLILGGIAIAIGIGLNSVFYFAGEFSIVYAFSITAILFVITTIILKLISKSDIEFFVKIFHDFIQSKIIAKKDEKPNK